MPIAKSTKLKSGSISGNQKDKYINRVRFFEADESIGQRITLFVPGNNIGVATAEVGRIACKAQSAPEFSAFESPQALRTSSPCAQGEPLGNEKEQAIWLALWLVFDQIARSTLLERRHLVQTYTWRGVPSTIALTRLTLGFHARFARL